MPVSSTPPPLGDAARDLALRILAHQARRFPDLAVVELETKGLTPRDGALAVAIYESAVERWLTLSHLVNLYLMKPMSALEPRLAAVLLAGAAQLLMMDRLPAHAVINHAVEWAKQRVRPGAGPMANAVLRKVAALRLPDDQGGRRPTYTGQRDELPLADGSAIVLAQPVLPESELERLAVASSHPPALLETWGQRMSPHQVRALAMHSLVRPPITLCTAYTLGPLPRDLLTPHDSPNHHVFSGPRSALTELLEARPDIWVQDAASSTAVESVRTLNPRLIIDLCAGQGTKTRQLEAVFPDARIVATDTDGARRAVLAGVFEGNPRVKVLPIEEIKVACVEQADLVLLDVPCSNTGVLARRPEARYRVDQSHLDSVTALQRQIIVDAIPLLAMKPRRGMILYSTCSLEPQENQQQVEWAVKWHRFRSAHEENRMPAGAPGGPPTSYCDGAYSVLLS
ncbi:MAG: hypothetical protein H7Y88_06390 [Phycisphaerales bacterium]|nr:hypothetical protein [Phycisphaerales bacterium]